MESWVQSWRPRANAFCDFSSPPVWSTAPATKNWCQVIRSAAPVTQNHFNKPEDLMLQNATPLRKSAPGPPNSSDEHVSCTAPAMENASLQIFFKCLRPAIVFGNATKPSRFAHFWQSPQSLAPAKRNDIWTSKSGPNVFLTFWLRNVLQRPALFRHLDFQKWSEHGMLCTCWLRNVLRATAACIFSTSQLLKVFQSWGVLYILTWTCAWRHNSVHFFDIATSKSVPKLKCFVHFDFEMCFAPQRYALFRHVNFQKWQKWSEPGVFCTFWLGNLLRATTACNFSSLIWPAGSAPVALASLLLDPPEPQIIGKTQCFATFLPFRAPASSFFWLFLFSDLLSPALLFSILLLHLCFSSVHIVGNLTSRF